MIWETPPRSWPIGNVLSLVSILPSSYLIPLSFSFFPFPSLFLPYRDANLLPPTQKRPDTRELKFTSIKNYSWQAFPIMFFEAENACSSLYLGCIESNDSGRQKDIYLEYLEASDSHLGTVHMRLLPRI